MITRQGIEAAVTGLDYQNPESLKYKLVHAVWGHYGDAETVQPTERIDPEGLIHTLWRVTDPAALQEKRRNLSSTKSAVNRDLKRAYREGRNPEGVIIGRDNCFALCDEAKDDLLSAVDLAGTRDSAAAVKQISNSLEAIRSVLANTPGGTDGEGAVERGALEELRQTIQEVAEAFDLAPPNGGAAGPGSIGGEEGETPSLEATLEVAEEIDEMEVDTEAEEEIVEEILEEEAAEEVPGETGVDALPEAVTEGNNDGGPIGGGETGPPVGLPLDGSADPDLYSLGDGRDPRLLAEAFDGYLGAMERFYNQYLLIPEGPYPRPSSPEGTGGSNATLQVAAFYMGKFPVTNALFEVFVERTGYVTLAERLGYSTVYYGRLSKREDPATGRVIYRSTASVRSCTVPEACWHRPTGPGSSLHQKRNHPVVHVALEDAAAFAAWTGKRLPTEKEWEAAAGTDRGYPFPWGDTWESGTCNVEETAIAETAPVNAFDGGENGLGIGDTLGNVLEWTTDAWDAIAGIRCQVLKGGSWISPTGITLFDRFKLAPQSTSNICGFRCAVD